MSGCFVFSLSDELENEDENDDEKEEENEEEFSHFNGDISLDGDPAGARGVSGPSPSPSPSPSRPLPPPDCSSADIVKAFVSSYL